MDLHGSIAAITGGANGIGKAIVAALLQKKAKVLYIVILLRVLSI